MSIDPVPTFAIENRPPPEMNRGTAGSFLVYLRSTGLRERLEEVGWIVKLGDHCVHTELFWVFVTNDSATVENDRAFIAQRPQGFRYTSSPQTVHVQEYQSDVRIVLCNVNRGLRMVCFDHCMTAFFGENDLDEIGDHGLIIGYQYLHLLLPLDATSLFGFVALF